MEAKHISDEIAADDNGISASANPGNNAALTIGGALHSGNTVTNTGGRYTFGGDISTPRMLSRSPGRGGPRPLSRRANRHNCNHH